jgi:myo-inositol-1(or 4)-monophosphatase
MALDRVEQEAIDNFQGQQNPEGGLEVNDDNLKSVGIQVALKMGEMVQRARADLGSIQFSKKADGSRVTNIDKNAETLAREIIGRSFPDHLVTGEEQGGIADSERYTWAIDPIDGTNVFLSHENTAGVSVCLFKDEVAVMSVVYNPFTGELYYAFGSDRSRLIRQYGFSNEVTGDDLPLQSIEPEQASKFVNVHPVIRNFPPNKRLRRALVDGKIDKLLQIGGSPAVELASITKGHFTTILNWGKEQADPWDLAAGVHIVRNAGGVVTDIHNRDIELVGHSGLVVASINKELHDLVLGIINQAEIGG